MCPRRWRKIAYFLTAVIVTIVVGEVFMQGTPTVRSISKFASIDPSGAGVAAIVTIGDQVVIREMLGVADTALGSPIDELTRFDLASLSKQFTAYAVLILEEAGSIDRAATLDRYLPNMPSWAKRVRIKNLLAHMGGVPEISLPCWLPGRTTNADILRALQGKSDLLFEPGSRFEYSNTGYILLSAVVEVVTGQVFNEVVNERILMPLGITDGGTLARSYNAWPLTFALSQNPCDGVYGDGGMTLSLDGYRKWLREVEHPTLVRSATWARALATGPYAYGWNVSMVDGVQQHEHRGTWLGFRNYVIGVPSRRTWIVVLSNNADIDRGSLVADLLRRTRDKIDVRLSPTTLQIPKPAL